MARLRIVSDLHLDCCMMAPRLGVGADAAVVAGDVLNGANASKVIALLGHLFPEPEIVYVPGNHEGYGQPDYEGTVADFVRAAEGTRVRVLARTDVELASGPTVLGATLWTDFNLYGKHRKDDAMNAVGHAINDFRMIRTQGRRLTPQDTLDWHRLDRAWIEKRSAELHGRQLVCITHHGPRRESLAPRYALDIVSAGFLSDLPASVLNPFALWIHGHTHTSFDYKVGSTRVICNPRGYTRTPESSDENPAFDPDLVVEV